jgi:hypothetical protein
MFLDVSSGATLHTPSKQSTLPRGAAAYRCIRFTLSLSLLLVLLAPENVSLSLACPRSLLCLAIIQSTICCAILGLSILQPTFVSALLHSVCHHYNRLSALLRDSDGIVSERDLATIRSALSCDTTTDYLLCFSASSLFVNALKLHVLY